MGNVNLVIVILIVLIFVWVITINKQPTINKQSQEKYSTITQQNYGNGKTPQNNTEDAYEILGNNDVDEAFKLGFGMGPGIYGSGRHFSEMVIL